MEKSITAANGQIITAKVSDPVIVGSGRNASVPLQTLDLTISPVPVTPVPDPTPEPVPGYQLVFESGFDKRSDIDNADSMQYGNGVISTTVFKTAPGSFYAVPANVSSGIRSEVQYVQDYQNPVEGAVEYDAMYEKVIQNNIHSFQWHPETSGASASPGLLHQGGKFTVVRFRNGGNDYGATNYTIPTGKWIHIRMEFKFAKTYAYFRLIIDGVLVWELKPSSTSWLGDGSGQYIKIGSNGWGSDAGQSRIYYDNLKIYKKQ